MFGELSGAATIDPRATFFELGFDSLGLTQAVLQIQKRFGVKVTFRQLLSEMPTLESLARYIGDQAPVILSEAKDLPATQQILRVAQDDKHGPNSNLLARLSGVHQHTR